MKWLIGDFQAGGLRRGAELDVQDKLGVNACTAACKLEQQD
jgi:hypothetical protein